MSGLGKVAEGVLLPSGMVVMWWLTDLPSSVGIYPNIEALKHIHGHGDKNTTDIIWDE